MNRKTILYIIALAMGACHPRVFSETPSADLTGWVSANSLVGEIRELQNLRPGQTNSIEKAFMLIDKIKDIEPSFKSRVSGAFNSHFARYFKSETEAHSHGFAHHHTVTSFKYYYVIIQDDRFIKDRQSLAGILDEIPGGSPERIILLYELLALESNPSVRKGLLDVISNQTNALHYNRVTRTRNAKGQIFIDLKDEDSMNMLNKLSHAKLAILARQKKVAEMNVQGEGKEGPDPDPKPPSAEQ